MNEIQTGTSASQLSPQNFSNSNQSGSLQGVNSSSDILNKGQQVDVNNLGSSSGSLRVVTLQRPSTLGVQAINYKTVSAAETPINPIFNTLPSSVFVVFIVIACVAVFKKFSALEEIIVDSE